MKKKNYKVHIAYLICIAILLVAGMALVMLMVNERSQLLVEREEKALLDREQLVGSIEEAEGALRMAAHTESTAVYAAKMQRLAEGCASAALLTEQNDPSSVWGMFWTRLSDFAEGEIASSIGKQSVTPDRALLERYADLLARLKAEPDALKGPLWEDLPEGLSMPRLQTEFSLGESKLRSNAAHILKISSGLLKKRESGMEGLVRYHCSNAEIDLLISGQLVYLDLQLPRKEGSIGRSEGIRRLTEFLSEQGYGDAEVIDLYENEGVLWARMAPTVEVSRYGAVKNLDRPLIAACTLWSGRVCHFEVNPSGHDEVIVHSEELISERQMKKLAAQKNAELGEAVVCKGRLCRTLIVDRASDGSAIHLYLDAIDGSERELALRYSPSPDELPASALWEDVQELPAAIGELPPFGEWQRRRYCSSVFECTWFGRI